MKSKKIYLFFVIALTFLTGYQYVNMHSEDQNEVKTMDASKRNPKKGFCVTTRQGNNWVKKLNMLNVSNHYSWGYHLKSTEPQDIEFIPMIWSTRGDVDGLQKPIEQLKDWADEEKIHYLLGFNEPDGKKQANMTVDQAIAAWPMLMQPDLKLGSPACVHADNGWMQEFMHKADSLDYRVDFITVHWYGGPNVNGFIDYLKKIHKIYHRPIWITEFAIGDWKAKQVSDNRYSPQQILSFMKDLLPKLDKLDFVKKYFWFSASTQSAALGHSALFNEDGTLTELGKYYSQYQ